MCQNEEVFNLWYHALKYVTDYIRNQKHHMRTAPPGTTMPIGGGQIQGYAQGTIGFPISDIPGDCYIWGAAPDTPRSLKNTELELLKVPNPHLVPSSQKLDIIQVSCGPRHFTAVTRSGNLYTWGSGENGRLGLGSLQHSRNPTTVPELTAVKSVSCGDSNSAAITADGSLYTWGSGLTGQLGHGDSITQYLPKKILSISHVKISQVSCGPFHSAAISEDNWLFTWGDGFGGKLGHGDEKSISTPRMVQGLRDVIGVSCGWWHTAAIVREPDQSESRASLFTWGGHFSWGDESNKGCLGNGLKTGEWYPTKVTYGLESKHVKRVACGLNLTVALTKDGAVYQMGTTAAEAPNVPWEGAKIPSKVEGPLKKVFADQVSCGNQHVVVVASANKSDRKSQVYSWGKGKRGQLGLGDHQDHSTPQLIEELISRRVLNVCCGGDYTLIVCSHDQRIAASTGIDIPMLPVPNESSPTISQNRRQNHQSRTSGHVVQPNQLRLPLKKSPLTARQDLGSLDYSSATGSSSSSIRKLRTDLLYAGQRLDRTRTGSTPLSEAPSDNYTPIGTDDRQAYPSGRTGTPNSMNGSQEGTRMANSSVPDFQSVSKFDTIKSGDAESILSDPCGRADDSSSEDDASLANTDGQFATDAYSEEESTAHKSAPSFSEKGADDSQSVQKQLPDSFRMPTLPFPPTADVVPTTSARFLSMSNATAARIRTRQRGLERRLGITDTWTSDKLISRENSEPPRLDILSTTACCFGSQEAIREEGSQTARERPRIDDKEGTSSQRHRRTNSEQHVYLNSLKESLKNVEDSKGKLTTYSKFLDSVEEWLMTIAARQRDELKSVDSDLKAVMALLDADISQKRVGPFFEAGTVEKTINVILKVSDQLNARAKDEDEGRSRIERYEGIFCKISELIEELKTALGISDFSVDLKLGESHSVEESATQRREEENIKSEVEGSSKDPPTSGDGSQSTHMWMEKVDPGVSIVFQTTTSGKTKIKKIRFAKRMFAWDEAQKWWEENQDRLIRDYQLEPGFDPLNQSASEN